MYGRAIASLGDNSGGSVGLRPTLSAAAYDDRYSTFACK